MLLLLGVNDNSISPIESNEFQICRTILFGFSDDGITFVSFIH